MLFNSAAGIFFQFLALGNRMGRTLMTMVNTTEAMREVRRKLDIPNSNLASG